jgi:predicted lactoylglutathione lyase
VSCTKRRYGSWVLEQSDLRGFERDEFASGRGVVTSMDYTICLATADRSRSLAFYRDGLGLEAFGPLADDGVPEPLQLRLAPSVSLMLIPSGGFGWVAGEDRVAPPGANECVLSVYAADEHAVRARYEAALAAGGTSVYEPVQQGWNAFAAQVADPDGHLWMLLVVPPDWTD